MTLDSTAVSTNANGGKNGIETEETTVPRREKCAAEQESSEPWFYLFVHHSKTETVNDKLREKFNTFIHKEVAYKAEKNRIKKINRYTIPGLLFVQGSQVEIQNYLRDSFSSLYLTRDCATGKVAEIADHAMRSFMRISSVAPTRIRFMPHAFGYYSAGNTLVRITSGLLEGMEGYRIRIARDRCLVTSIGGMSIAISGVHKENFENVDEYARQRNGATAAKSLPQLTPTQQDIANFFFTPQNELDVMVIANKCSRYLIKLKSLAGSGACREAVEVGTFLLETIGTHFTDVRSELRKGPFADVLSAVAEVDSLLAGLAGNAAVPAEQVETINATLPLLRMRFPFLFN